MDMNDKRKQKIQRNRGEVLSNVWICYLAKDEYLHSYTGKRTKTHDRQKTKRNQRKKNHPKRSHGSTHKRAKR